MRWSAIFVQVRVILVTVSLGFAFLAQGLLTQHYVLAAQKAEAGKVELMTQMRGLIERLAEVESALGTVQTYRKSLDLMSLKEFEGVLDKTGLKASPQAGIRTALAVAPVGDFTGGESSVQTYSGALIYGDIIDRMASARQRAASLSSDLKGTALQVSKRQGILAAIPSVLPARGWVSSEFGVRESPFHKGLDKMHNGVDIAADVGTPVFAPADGVVRFAGLNGSYGRFVNISHGYGISTRYAHNADLKVKTGQHVKRGEQIATIGITGRTTGAHLHYEVLVYDEAVNPRRFLFDAKPEDMQAPKVAVVVPLAAEAPMGGEAATGEMDADSEFLSAVRAARDGASAGEIGELGGVRATWDAPVFTVEKGLIGRWAPGFLHSATTGDLLLATVLLLLFSIAAAAVRMPEPARSRARRELSAVEAYEERLRAARASARELSWDAAGLPRWERLLRRAKAKVLGDAQDPEVKVETAGLVVEET